MQLQRQLDLCAVRTSAACQQYEGVVDDWRAWLVHMRDTYGLKPKRGFPVEVLQLTVFNIAGPRVCSQLLSNLVATIRFKLLDCLHFHLACRQGRVDFGRYVVHLCC